jgi:hypothetical protein
MASPVVAADGPDASDTRTARTPRTPREGTRYHLSDRR